MKTYKEILNNKSTQQIRLITIHNRECEKKSVKKNPSMIEYK